MFNRITTNDLIVNSECMDFDSTKDYIDSNNLRYYVYFLVDPFSYQIKYIGKGQGYRCLKHWEDFKEGRNKQVWLNKLRKRKRPYLIAIWEFYEDEITALEQEDNFILMFGRKGIDRNGSLLNIQRDSEGLMFKAISKPKSYFYKEAEKVHPNKFKYINYKDGLIYCKCLRCNSKINPRYDNLIRADEPCINCYDVNKTVQKATKTSKENGWYADLSNIQSQRQKEVQENGLTRAENSGRKVSNTLLEIDEETGLTRGQLIRRKSAKLIHIYNSKDELMFKCKGDFIETIKEHGLPKDGLMRSIKDGKPYYASTNFKYRKFFGWYAKEMQTLSFIQWIA